MKGLWPCGPYEVHSKWAGTWRSTKENSSCRLGKEKQAPLHSLDRTGKSLVTEQSVKNGEWKKEPDVKRLSLEQ